MFGKIPSGWIIFTHARKVNVLLAFSPTAGVSITLCFTLVSLIPAVAQKRQLLREGSNQKVAAPRSERRVNKKCPVDLGAKLNNSVVSPLVKLGDEPLCSGADMEPACPGCRAISIHLQAVSSSHRRTTSTTWLKFAIGPERENGERTFASKKLRYVWNINLHPFESRLGFFIHCGEDLNFNWRFQKKEACCVSRARSWVSGWVGLVVQAYKASPGDKSRCSPIEGRNVFAWGKWICIMHSAVKRWALLVKTSTIVLARVALFWNARIYLCVFSSAAGGTSKEGRLQRKVATFGKWS